MEKYLISTKATLQLGILIFCSMKICILDGSPCSKNPKLIISSPKEGIEDVSHLKTMSDKAYFLKKPTGVKLICSGARPIQIEVETEMAFISKDVHLIRRTGNIFNTSTYCYTLQVKLPADYRITGKYICSVIGRREKQSSIFIFSNDKHGVLLLNNETETYTTGIPDNKGWIRIPCVSTDPRLTPTLFKEKSCEALSDCKRESLKYDVGYGFRINATSQECCSKKYTCEILYQTKDGKVFSKSSTTMILDNYDGIALTAKIYSRVWPNHRVLGFYNKPTTDIYVNLSEPFEIICESNVDVRLETDASLSSWNPKMFRNVGTFYAYKVVMRGQVNHSRNAQVKCVNGSRTIHEWNIKIIQPQGPSPGINISSQNYYPITCFSSGLHHPSISIIVCNDPINCQVAEKFSSLLLNENKFVTKERFPFYNIQGRAKCSYNRKTKKNCAHVDYTLGMKRGIVKCVEMKGPPITYTEKILFALNNSIIKLPKRTEEELAVHEEASKILQMDPINDIVYVDEKVTFRCNASYGIFSIGLQLMVELENDRNLTSNNFGNLEFNEALDNAVLTFEAKLTIEHSNIKRISCYAPVWNTNTWRVVSESVTVKVGAYPKIMGNDGSSTLEFDLNEMNRTLRCEVSGDPLPEVVWYKDNDVISEENTKVSRIEAFGNISILQLRPITEAHAGNYVCQAKNLKGITRKTFKVELKGNSITLVLCLVLIGAAILVSVASLVVYIKYFQRPLEKLSYSEIHEFEYGNQNLVKKFAELNEIARYLPYKHDFEIRKDKIELLEDEMLGAGAFGLVIKGYLTRHSERFPVAIKTVRSNSDISHLRNLLSEIKILMYVGTHPNIIQLMGAMTRQLREGKLHVVVEFCSRGNLLSVLRDSRETFVNQITNDKLDLSITTSQTHYLRPLSNISTRSWKIDDFVHGNERLSQRSSNSIKTSDLIAWSYQTANGMEYLGTKKVVHGDLATRNLLLTSDSVIKISDFGLSSHLYDYTNYTKKQKEEPVPWRWLSVEALRDSKFSIETDVWAYGVTLWEIFSLGEVPYQGYSWGKEFVEELYAGLRLSPTQYTTKDIYTKMVGCWEAQPQDRLSFIELREYFKSLIPDTIEK